MAKDSLARGAQSAVFVGGTPSKDDPIEFHGTVAMEETSVALIESGLARLAERVGEEKANHQAHLAFIEKCQPLNDRVLLRRIVEQDNRLIVEPDQYKQPLPKGEVIAVGSYMMVGNAAVVIPLQPGDRIFFGEYNAESFMLDGEELLLISAYDARLKVPA